MNQKVTSNIALVCCALIWGSGFVGQKIGMETIGPFYFIVGRMFIGGLALLPFALLTRQREQRQSAVSTGPGSLSKRDRMGIYGGLLGGVILYIAELLQQIGLLSISAGKSAFLTVLYILLVPIFGILLRQRTPLRVWCAAAIAVVGLYLLCLTEQLTFSSGSGITLLGTIFWAAHIHCMSYFSPRANVSLIVCLQCFVGGFLGLVVSPFFETFSWESFLAALPAIAYVGVFSTGIAYLLQGIGQRHADPTVASILMSLESVFAALWGFLLLHEVFTLREGLGCLLMFAAIIIAQLPSRREAGNRVE